MRRLAVSVVAALAAPAPLLAQATDAPPPPPIRRWVDVQTWTAYTRYRYIENSADVKTADQWQYKNALRARFNFDEKKRYTLNVGVFSGTNFIGTWDNTGVGTGVGQTQHFVKQLFAAAAPVDGLELQYGGIYVNRGVNTEITTYDEDGYIVGERIQIRRPKELFFDEISATRGLIGPFTTPAIGDRWRGLHEANYGQVLVAKRIGKLLRASADYTNQQHQSGNDTLRAAAAMTVPGVPVVEGVRYEQYYRFTGRTAAGFAALADLRFLKRYRLETGYVTVDEFYIGYPQDKNGWNADRIQRGRRLVFYGTIPIWRELSVAPYYTHAFKSPYSVALKNRFDFVVQYDVLGSLRRAGAL